MGFLSDVTDSINRGTNAASRSAKVLRLRNQISKATAQRHDLAAQLGASLYDLTKDDPAFTEGREQLYEGIAACDQQRKELHAEIAIIEAESRSEGAEFRKITCTSCGASVRESALFCSGCGKPVSEIRDEVRQEQERERAQAQQAADATDSYLICPQCGGRVVVGDKFCETCGNPVDFEPTPSPS